MSELSELDLQNLRHLIGGAESGVRNLFKFCKFYSGQKPQFVEVDVFWIIVPLDEAYSFNYSQTESANNATNATNLILTEEEQRILHILKENPTITQKDISERAGISLGTVKRILPKLQEKGALVRIGNRRSGIWQILKGNEELIKRFAYPSVNFKKTTDRAAT